MLQAHHTMHPLQIIRGSAKYIALLGTPAPFLPEK